MQTFSIFELANQAELQSLETSKFSKPMESLKVILSNFLLSLNIPLMAS